MDHNEKINCHHEKIDEVVNSQEYISGGDGISEAGLKAILFDILDYTKNDELRTSRVSCTYDLYHVFDRESLTRMITNYNQASSLMNKVLNSFVKNRNILPKEDETIRNVVHGMRVMRFRAVTMREILIKIYHGESLEINTSLFSVDQDE